MYSETLLEWLQARTEDGEVPTHPDGVPFDGRPHDGAGSGIDAVDQMMQGF